MLRLTLDPRTKYDDDPVAVFADINIGDAETLTFEVAHVGFEDAPDILTVNRAGEVIEARSADA